ncbi:putative membrane protein [Salirhabdus euzebyi]|uniref:Putative membrane protein n=1 Tax=Salirhabdus euzebyi TaxID=394506 RepID=A0A841Q3Q8_9BACI|nr:DUF2157 domain-containing protein [Salirhabdus euzebyi]MBB6453003.1 putative membrane protein [Salirhabdus euzebyi]
MKRKQVEREGEKWVREGIITLDQYNSILNRYPKKNEHAVLLIFAAIFIGLGFLTFIASNWSFLPAVAKMTIIIVSLLVFYIVGEWIYENRSKKVGLSFYTIGLFLFGAGIFLTGQMYHYTFYDAFPFFIWTLASIFVYLHRRETFLLFFVLLILTVGQLYEAFQFSDFNGWIAILLVVWFYLFLKVHKKPVYWLSYLFGISMLAHFFIFSISEWEYVMFLPMILFVYLIGEIQGKPYIKNPIQTIAQSTMFIVLTVHVFLLGINGFMEGLEMDIKFHLSYASLFIGLIAWKIYKQKFGELTDLILFIPVLYLGNFADFASLLVLFVFSVTYLTLGYQDWDQHKVNKGTIALIISTIVAYIQLAWDYLDKSLFFFVGGVFLFALSYFLEKRRRNVVRKQRSDG